MTASVRGDRYFSNDVNHSMGPALIGEEIDDSVDLTPGDIVVYWGRCLSVSVMDTRFQVCVQEIRSIAKAHPKLTNGGDRFRIIYVGGVFAFCQSCRIISTETDERSQTTAE